MGVEWGGDERRTQPLWVKSLGRMLSDMIERRLPPIETQTSTELTGVEAGEFLVTSDQRTEIVLQTCQRNVRADRRCRVR